MNRQCFNEDELIKVVDNLPKYSLEDFEVGMIVYLRSGGPDMWVIEISGEEIECGLIENNKSDSYIFPYRCLAIKNKFEIGD